MKQSFGSVDVSADTFDPHIDSLNDCEGILTVGRLQERYRKLSRDELMLCTLLVELVEQTSAVAPERLDEFVGRVSLDELEAINDALRLALELD